MIVPESYMEAEFIGKGIVFTVTINGASMDSWGVQKQKEVNAKLKIEAHGMSLEDFAKGQVKQKLMFDFIADKEKIKLKDSEYKKNLESFAKDMGYTDKEKFATEYGKEKIKQAMLWDKIQLYLLEKAVFK